MNRSVLTAGVVIGTFGVVHAVTTGKPFSRVLLGTYVFVGLLALLDAFGGVLSSVASGLALVAMLTAILTLVPDVYGQITTIIKGAPKAV